VRKVMFLLAVVAVVILLVAPAATARKNSTATSTSMSSASTSASASSSGTATASSSATAAGKKGAKKGGLPKTGGPAPMALLAGAILVGSGAVALGYLRRREVS
jgi:LPXTG-motif cell wall-anchored protein